MELFSKDAWLDAIKKSPIDYVVSGVFGSVVTWIVARIGVPTLDQMSWPLTGLGYALLFFLFTFLSIALLGLLRWTTGGLTLPSLSSETFVAQADLQRLFDMAGPAPGAAFMTFFPNEAPPTDEEVLLLVMYGHARLTGDEDISVLALRDGMHASAMQNYKLYEKPRTLSLNAMRDLITREFVENDARALIDAGDIERVRLSGSLPYYRLTRKGRARAARVARDLIGRA